MLLVYSGLNSENYMKKVLFGLGGLLFVFGLIVVFDPFGFSGKVTETTPESTLEIIRGKVSLNGIGLEPGKVLAEGDMIEVAADAEARIVFFDDSVSRLRAGTKVQLKVLEDENFDLGESHILLDLATGEVWSNVQPQVGEDVSFEIETAAVNATIRGTVFNIKTDGIATDIHTTEHSVLVAPKDENGEISAEIALIEGEKVAGQTLATGLVVLDIEETELAQPWFETNVAADVKHKGAVKQRIERQQKRRAGALPGTIGYPVKKIREKISRVLATEAEQADLELAIVERELAEAQVLYNYGREARAESVLKKAEATLAKFTNDPATATRARRVVRETQHKLRQVLPDEEAYDLKESLRQFELEFVPAADRERLEKRLFERKVLEHFDVRKGAADQRSFERWKKLEAAWGEKEVPEYARRFVEKIREKFVDETRQFERFELNGGASLESVLENLELISAEMEAELMALEFTEADFEHDVSDFEQTETTEEDETNEVSEPEPVTEIAPVFVAIGEFFERFKADMGERSRADIIAEFEARLEELAPADRERARGRLRDFLVDRERRRLELEQKEVLEESESVAPVIEAVRPESGNEEKEEEPIVATAEPVTEWLCPVGSFADKQKCFE